MSVVASVTVWVSAARRRPSFVDARVASVTELPRLVFRYGAE